MTLDERAVLGEDGRIAQRLEHWEHRPQQLEMAEAVRRAIDEKGHLVVEAGTGVGKSFAYLVPAILAAHDSRGHERGEGESKRRRIVVSTQTISLQEQLIEKDVPFLNAILPVEFSAVLVKGRSNYLSLRRAAGAGERARSLFDESDPVEQLGRIREWSGRTSDGSRSDLEFQPLPTVWDEVRSEHGNCLGRKCPTYDDCFYYAARRRVWNADLLVVNHALFFSDLALRREGAQVLPDYDVVVLDEAHTVEAVAGDHMGLAVSSGQIDYLLGKLYNDRTQKGLLVHHQLGELQSLVDRIRFASDAFFADVRDWRDRHARSNGRVRAPLEGVENPVSPPLRRLAGEIVEFAESIEKDEQRIELVAAAERCIGTSVALDDWLGQRRADSVYWVEPGGRGGRQTKLVCSPIDVGPILREELFDAVPTVVLTSATLAVGRRDFGFVQGRLGLSNTETLQLGSPFDYREQARLVVDDEMPDPTENPLVYESAVQDRLRRIVEATDDGVFVLFTSYRMMKNCADRMLPWFTERKRPLFVQGGDLPRSLMLERFKKSAGGVLFGTDSFWQGVDVPGDALRTVVITKLPFSVPDHPLLEARLDAIRRGGGNPFMEYQLPEAVIKLKQGFGRLIRTRRDTGDVFVLDPRVRTKRYGRLFLDSLPECGTGKTID